MILEHPVGVSQNSNDDNSHANRAACFVYGCEGDNVNSIRNFVVPYW